MPHRSWAQRLEPLVAHRAWALLGEYGSVNAARVAASNLRRGAIPVPEGQWRFVAAPNPATASSGATDAPAAFVYGRFLGGG